MVFNSRNKETEIEYFVFIGIGLVYESLFEKFARHFNESDDLVVRFEVKSLIGSLDFIF